MQIEQKDIKNAIQEGQVKLLLEAAPLSMASGIVLFTLLIILLGFDVEHAYWAALFVLGWLIRFAATLFVWFSVDFIAKRLLILRAGVFLYAITWGFIILGMYWHGDETEKVFLLFALMGLTIGGITSFSADKLTSIPFYISTLLPVSVAMSFDDSISVIYSAGVDFYMLFLLTILFRLNSSVVKSLESEYISASFLL